MQFIPSPGVVLIEPIEDPDKTKIQLDIKTKGRVLKGKVVAVGAAVIELEPPEFYAIVGRIIYFLSYEGDYDNAKIQGKKYYMVKFGDIRGMMT